jgi:hypothetical protein
MTFQNCFGQFETVACTGQSVRSKQEQAAGYVGAIRVTDRQQILPIKSVLRRGLLDEIGKLVSATD